MTILRRLLGIGCLAIALTGWSSAQTTTTLSGFPPEETTETWLLSGNPRLVAWGAHYAVAAHSPALIDDLLALASRWQPTIREEIDDSERGQLSPRQEEKRDAMAEVLDALIQLNQSVPVETLRNLAPDFGNDVAVLLSRLPPDEAESVVFAFYGSPADHGKGLQYVSAGLLAQHPLPGFAADLLRSISVSATILVVDPNSGAGFGGGRCGGAYAISTDRPRVGWPKIGQYVLSKQKTYGAFQLVTGVNPVYATRKELAQYLRDICGGGVYLSSSERLRLIAEMLELAPEAIPWQTDLTKDIEFQSLEQFHRAVLAFVAEQQQKYRATVAALSDRGLLTPAEAAESLPKLQLNLRDARSEGAAPIPEPENLPDRVEWSSAPI